MVTGSYTDDQFIPLRERVNGSSGYWFYSVPPLPYSSINVHLRRVPHKGRDNSGNGTNCDGSWSQDVPGSDIITPQPHLPPRSKPVTSWSSGLKSEPRCVTPLWTLGISAFQCQTWTCCVRPPKDNQKGASFDWRGIKTGRGYVWITDFSWHQLGLIPRH